MAPAVSAPLQRIVCPACNALLFKATDAGLGVDIEVKCNRNHLVRVWRITEAWERQMLPDPRPN
jgi:phage FluMu protein Com